MQALGWLLYGLAALSVFGAVSTVARIGKPRAEVVTGGQAAFSVLFSAGYVVVFVVAGSMLLNGV